MNGSLAETLVTGMDKNDARYVYFNIPAKDIHTKKIEKKVEFLLVGESNEVLQHLVGQFASGFAFPSFEKLQVFLKRIADKQLDKADAEYVVIFNTLPSSVELKKLRNCLSADSRFYDTPVLLNAKVDTAELNRKNSVYQQFDDIVNVIKLGPSLIKRIQFIRRCKAVPTASNVAMTSGVVEKESKRSFFDILKRGIDILAASVLLIIFSPIMLLVALAIRLESRGNIFYVSKRAGRGYKVFDFYKFRTMVAEADKKVESLQHLNQYNNNEGQNSAVFFKLKNDPRVTTLGKILRNTSLDELPQLFNVLRGDMSLVGNRPLPLYEAKMLTTDEFAERFMAPAGITGLWQVRKRGKGDMSDEERIALDIEYAQKHNLLFDLQIMAGTVKALIQKENV